MPDHPHLRWMRETADQIQKDYERLHDVAANDPQRAGHGGESTWKELLTNWLPPSYEVVTRRYIVPEDGEDTFETDLVVISPGYPQKLREREEIMAGGVAAAFCVRLTVDAGGINDAIDRATRLRRGLKPRHGSARAEMLGAFPVGLLAHAHIWTGEHSDPTANVTTGLEKQYETALHPRELLDFVCVANLGTWSAARMPYAPPATLAHLQGAPQSFAQQGAAITAFVQSFAEMSPDPVAMQIAHLFERLSLDDPGLRRTADGFRLTNTLGGGSGLQHHWPLAAVFSEGVISQLPNRIFSGLGDVDWRAAYM
jgi:hypothetical protein